MPRLPEACTATIVIEWENVLLAEADRCRTMLAELMRQIDLFPGAGPDGDRGFEVLIVFDTTKLSEGDVRGFFDACVGHVPASVTLRFLPSDGLGYYEQKNLGAREARGRFVVFLDSDVIPEPAWLERLLASFEDPRVNVVCGNCFLAADDLVSKSMALAWFFPFRDESDSLLPRDVFFANNVAFRRSVALAYPFEPIEGTTRGACRMLAKRLSAERAGLFVNTAARVSHPAPNGLVHLVSRGVAQGRDNLLIERITGRGGIARSMIRGLKLQLRAWKRILFEHRRVGLGLHAVPAALAIASFYYICYFVGDVLARVAPEWTRRHVRLEG